MENLQELNAKIEDLLRLKKEANELIETTFRNDLKLSDTAKVRNIDTGNFLVVECLDFSDFKSVLLNAVYAYNSHEKSHYNKTYYISSPFLFTIKNGFSRRALKFEYKMINGFKVWVEIDFSILTESVINLFDHKFRALYDSESIHVDASFRSKTFKDHRVLAYDFKGETLGWYGGDKTILNSEILEQEITKG